MDRVNRRFLVASTLIAVPVALLMVSLTTGTTPEVQQAVGQVADETAEVQQVVGKQPESRKTRPGLLQVLTGSQSRGSTNHQHHNMPNGEPKGLLDGFFEGSSRSNNSSKTSSSSSRRSATSSSHQHRHATSQSQSTGISQENWDGIPYHRVDNSSVRTGSSPIRNPRSQTAASSGATRIIRGGSNRSIQATPASVRRSSDPTRARRPAPPIPSRSAAAPITANDAVPAPTAQLSSSSSSRRSDRRSVEALDASEIAAAAKAAAPLEESSDLVPQVARKKEVQETPEPKAAVDLEAGVAQAQPASTPQPAPTPQAAPTPQPAPAPQPAPTPANEVAELAPQPSTALAAIGAPSAQAIAEPESARDALPLAPAGSPTAPQAAPGQPAYTLPVDPSTAPVPVAGIPTHPYAASTPAPNSTPASTASHRAGPPQAAFGAVTMGQPKFNAASTPVGSGVVPNGDVASYRRPASQPVQQRPGNPQVDPYVAGRTLATHGQQMPSNTPPATQYATVPMQPINGYTGPQPQAAGDDFSRSVEGSRNQMRHGSPSQVGAAASSELPGIRVITLGPDSIMIRQNSQYEIRVENRGSIDAEGLMIRALVPDWADLRGQNASRGDIDTVNQGSSDRLVWTIDHLPAGASERMFIRLTAARSGTYDLDVDWTLLPQKSVARVQVREPRLDLTIEGPEEVIYGQSQTYKVRVLNPGDGIAPNVVFTLSPNSATPQTQRIGDIPPGKEAQFDVELTAQDLGDLKIHGLANGDYELRAESAKTIRVAAAALEAVFSGPELKYQNTNAMYGLQIQNTGHATSEKIIATLRLPAGVKYLGGIDGATVQGNALRWEITALAPGATRNYQYQCNMESTGEHQFAFDCKGTAAGNANVALSTRVESISDLVLTVNDPSAPAPIGSDVTYEIVIHNRGSKEATDVRAVAQFSHGIEPQRIEGTSGEVVTGQVLFDSIPRIGAGQEVRLRVIAQAERAGHHRFRTEVRAGDTVLVAEEATHYMSPTSDRVSRRSTDSVVR